MMSHGAPDSVYTCIAKTEMYRVVQKYTARPATQLFRHILHLPSIASRRKRLSVTYVLYAKCSQRFVSVPADDDDGDDGDGLTHRFCGKCYYQIDDDEIYICDFCQK